MPGPAKQFRGGNAGYLHDRISTVPTRKKSEANESDRTVIAGCNFPEEYMLTLFKWQMLF